MRNRANLAASDGPRRARTSGNGSVRFFDPTQSIAVPGRPAAEGQILDAARRCLLMYGSAKMSLDDVARVASVSRRTVYKYFGNRDALISAVVDWSIDTIFDEIEKVLAKNDRFDDQAVGAAFSLWQSRRAATKIRWGGLLSEADEAFLLSRGSGPVLRRLIELLRPGLEQAREAGEVRADLDVGSACEWVARQAFSLSSVVESSFQIEGRAGIDEYIRSYVIRGLLPEGRRGRSRPKAKSAGRPRSDGSPPAGHGFAFFDPSQTVTFPGRAPTEARVLDGARKCMIQVGIDAMTIDMVMAAAGTSRGTVYAYFANKAELVRALMASLLDAVAAEMDQVMAEEETFEGGVVAAALVMLRWYERLMAAQALNAELYNLTATRDVALLIDSLLKTIRRHLDLARQRGEIRQDLNVDRATESVVRGLMSFYVIPSQTFDSADPEDLANFVRSYVVRGLV